MKTEIEKAYVNFVKARSSYNKMLGIFEAECQKHIDWGEVKSSDFAGDGLAIMIDDSLCGVPASILVSLIATGTLTKEEFEKYIYL